MPNENQEPEETQPRPEDLSFQVMPTNGHIKPEQFNTPVSDVKLEMPIEESHPFNNKITYIVISIIILAVLGALAYFLLYNKDESPTNTDENAQTVPQVWLKQYFGVDECADMSRCGNEADPDNDGLKNYDEFKARKGTDPNKPDSDDDGLADGDEVYIYLTQPAYKFSFCETVGGIACQYDDGSQVANEYDPITPGLKMTETRKQQIGSDTQKYKLHEPTITKLRNTTPTPSSTNTQRTPETYSVFIENDKFVPASVTINVGDTVIWLNKDATNHEIASNPHPTHTDLTELQSPSFSQTQTHSFKFTKAGTFGYHDHLKPTIKGTVIVK